VAGRSAYGARLGLAAALGCGALVLSIALTSARRAPRPAGSDAGGACAAIVDSLLGRYGVDRDGIRTWAAKAGGEPTGRIEEHIPVPASFRSLEFNHALARRLAPLGMSVVATERSRDNAVTMHIVRGGVTIRSLAFAPDER